MSVNIKAEIVRQSEKGVLIKCGAIQTWLPKSQITINRTIPAYGGDTVEQYEIEIPGWLAKEKGLTL